MDRAYLPDEFGRVVAGDEYAIRLDKGIELLGDIKKDTSMLPEIEKNTSLLPEIKKDTFVLHDIKKILEKMAEK